MDTPLNANTGGASVASTCRTCSRQNQRQSRADALLARPDDFRRDARALFSDLAARMIREEHELFPMAEQLEGGHAAAA